MKKTIIIFLSLFFCLATNAQSLKKLGLIFDRTTYNFGDVEQWNNQPASFTFTNKSKHSLTILPLFSENDLDVVIPDRPIAPGESIVIQAMYYTDGRGIFTRRFPIYFGNRAEPIFLKITGNIKSLSPQAYIQCPMSKPEMSKPRIELIGDVAEIETEIPLSGTTIEIIGLQNKKEVTLFSNSNGKFGAKLPVGNYMLTVSHPNYEKYSGSIYIGQTSPPLRIRLTPLLEIPLFAENKLEPKKEKREFENTEFINSRDNNPKTSDIENEITEEIELTKRPDIKTEQIEEKDNEIKPNNKLERDIEYVKNEPKDNPYTHEEKTEEVNKTPNTLTTYKESNTPNEIEDQTQQSKNNLHEELAEKRPKLNEEKTIRKETVIKEEEPKKEKDELDEKENNLTPKNFYTFKVIDKNSLDPIEGATIYLNDIYNKRNKHKEHSDIKGFSELEMEKSDYRFIATADGYISNEIRILKDDKSEVFKIFLSPVSDLYDDIYEAKKERAKENKEILSKLSFGKTEFSFAHEDPEKIITIDDDPILKKDNKIIETPPLKNNGDEPEFVEVIETVEPIIVDKIIVDNAKEDSLKKVIEDLEAIQKKEAKLEEENHAQRIEENKLKEQEKIDSLNNFIAELTAKNNQIENDLQKIATDKELLEEQNKRDKEKLEALETLNAEKIKTENNNPFSSKKYQANNIMFLIDISTSMEKKGKMEMLKTSIKNLVGILRDIDRVAIITYNQKTNVVLESVSGNNKEEILNAIDSLKTGGLTNGVRGITKAYDMLEYYFIPNGNNQIILATDGLFSKYNNEMTETELNRLVKKQAEENMKLTVVGFGKDEEGKDLMNKLARNGKGQYIQIKNDYMTRDVLIREVKLNSEIKTQD